MSNASTRSAKAEARKAKRARDVERLASLKERARQIVSCLPAEYASWGFTKTSAYAKCIVILRHKASLKRIHPDKLEPFVVHMEQRSKWLLEHCIVLQTLTDTAKEIPDGHHEYQSATSSLF